MSAERSCGEAATCGKAAGLRWPALSMARRPNWTLSLEMFSVTEVTLPTPIALVQLAAVVSRITTSYPARSDSGLASQLRAVRLVPGKPAGGVVWICRFLGVEGLVASAHRAAPFTLATRAVKSKS